MFFTYLGRTIKLGFQNFFRNFWLSVVTVIILFLTLFSITLLATINMIGNEAITLVKDKVDMDIYFKVGTDIEKVLDAKEFFENNDKVEKVTYISSEQALEDFKDEYKDDITISQSLEELDENPLPASLIVKARELNDYQGIIDMVENSSFESLIESKDYQDNQVVIERIDSTISKFWQVGIGISAVFAVISLLVVFNTFRITIYTYKEELMIMKLVGATNSFIRSPFLFKSIIYAIVATVLTMVIFYPLLIASAPFIDNFFEGYNFHLVDIFKQYAIIIFAIQFLCALVISAVSSLFAIGRYLRV